MTDIINRPWTATGIYDAPDTIEDRTQAEADRADRERDRADGAEAHARALLAEVVWRRTAELGHDPHILPKRVSEPIIDSLWDDLEGGIPAGDLDAGPYLLPWFEGTL